jgi:hypothetical protein
VGAVLSWLPSSLPSSLSSSSYPAPRCRGSPEGQVSPLPHERCLMRAFFCLKIATCRSPREATPHEDLPLLSLSGPPSTPAPCRSRRTVEVG